jgi:hypothetical protein
MSTANKLLRDIERFMREHDMSATAFGTEAMGDPAFVGRLRDGSGVRTSTLDRCYKFMVDADKKRGKPRNSLEAVA